MVFFIVVLRALAAILITNSHYTGVYPTDIIANGGLVGDIIFFAVSGYCLFNVKGNFFSWYGKRILRIYPVIIIATLAYVLLGQYSLKEKSFVWWFVYPTNYHFVASILILYIPFYFVMKFKVLKDKMPLIMLITLAVYLVIYVFFYDKSYYHIDTVREPMIRFLYFESMLLGAYFHKNDQKFRNKFNLIFGVIGTAVTFVAYFASKLAFSKYQSLAPFQLINQFLIFALLYCVFRLFISIDNKLENMPKPIKCIFEFLAKITLEIYVVQNVLIKLLKPHFSFPINWIVITASIIISAYALHLLSSLIIKGINMALLKFSKKQSKVKNEG